MNAGVRDTNALDEAFSIFKLEQIIHFSSSVTVYGMPQLVPYDEAHQNNPVIPYAYIKFIIENIISDFRKLELERGEKFLDISILWKPRSLAKLAKSQLV